LEVAAANKVAEGVKEDAKQKAEAKQEAEATATEAEAAREKEQADIAIAEGHSLAAPVLTLPPARTIRTALPSPCPPSCLHACLPAASVATAKDALKTAQDSKEPQAIHAAERALKLSEAQLATEKREAAAARIESEHAKQKAALAAEVEAHAKQVEEANEALQSEIGKEKAKLEPLGEKMAAVNRELVVAQEALLGLKRKERKETQIKVAEIEKKVAEALEGFNAQKAALILAGKNVLEHRKRGQIQSAALEISHYEGFMAEMEEKCLSFKGKPDHADENTLLKLVVLRLGVAGAMARRQQNELLLAGATQRLMEAKAVMDSPQSSLIETLTSELAALNAELSTVQNQLLTKPSAYSFSSPPDKKALKRRSDEIEEQITKRTQQLGTPRTREKKMDQFGSKVVRERLEKLTREEADFRQKSLESSTELAATQKALDTAEAADAEEARRREAGEVVAAEEDLVQAESLLAEMGKTEGPDGAGVKVAKARVKGAQANLEKEMREAFDAETRAQDAAEAAAQEGAMAESASILEKLDRIATAMEGMTGEVLTALLVSKRNLEVDLAQAGAEEVSRVLELQNKRLYKLQSGMLEATPYKRDVMKRQGEEIDKAIRLTSEEHSQAVAKLDIVMQNKLDEEQKEAAVAHANANREEEEALAAELALRVARESLFQAERLGDAAQIELAQAHVALCESEATRERQEAEEAKEDADWEEDESKSALQEQNLVRELDKLKKKASSCNGLLLRVQNAMLKDPSNESNTVEAEQLQGEVDKLTWEISVQRKALEEVNQKQKDALELRDEARQKRKEEKAGWKINNDLAATAVNQAQEQVETKREKDRREQAAAARLQGPAQAKKQEEHAFRADVEAALAGYPEIKPTADPQIAAHEAALAADALHSACGSQDQARLVFEATLADVTATMEASGDPTGPREALAERRKVLDAAWGQRGEAEAGVWASRAKEVVSECASYLADIGTAEKGLETASQGLEQAEKAREERAAKLVESEDKLLSSRAEEGDKANALREAEWRLGTNAKALAKYEADLAQPAQPDEGASHEASAAGIEAKLTQCKAQAPGLEQSVDTAQTEASAAHERTLELEKAVAELEAALEETRQRANALHTTAEAAASEAAGKANRVAEHARLKSITLKNGATEAKIRWQEKKKVTEGLRAKANFAQSALDKATEEGKEGGRLAAEVESTGHAALEAERELDFSRESAVRREAESSYGKVKASQVTITLFNAP